MDFALFLDEAPGALFSLGVADAEAGMNGALHAPDRVVDLDGPTGVVSANAGGAGPRVAGYRRCESAA